MTKIVLSGCTLQPLASYLKALGIMRLVSEQADGSLRADWSREYFTLDTGLDRESLVHFFLNKYTPSPALAPWNGGSGFYPKDRMDGISAILGSTDPRFKSYRQDIEKAMIIVKRAGADKGTGKADERRREDILRECRNQLSDRCVDWLDAAISISAEGRRSFAPILGTGGNEGRLDYTNNFMENVTNLLLPSDKKLPVRSLLENALFGTSTGGFQDLAVGQFDPGRSGGFNQGNGIESSSVVNPWNAVLTLEGAIAWAGGIYRKQGVSYKSILCSPFTVRASAVGFGSASEADGVTARAEIWTPVWKRPALYSEIRSLLREGRASVSGQVAENGLQFAEAATSLGVDRAISSFVRYSMLKRRGDSYIAMPAGQYPAHYRAVSDNVREAREFIKLAKSAATQTELDSVNSWAPMVRRAEESMLRVLISNDQGESLLELTSVIGEIHRFFLKRGSELPHRAILGSPSWITTCCSKSEGQIAAALASIRQNKSPDQQKPPRQGAALFSWAGRDLNERLTSFLDKRTREEHGQESKSYAALRFAPRSAIARFLDEDLDDALIEKLLCAFAFAKLPAVIDPQQDQSCRSYPAYCLIKQLYADTAPKDEASTKLKPDPAIPALLKAERVGDAVDTAIGRLRMAGLSPYITSGCNQNGGPRLAAALLIPVSLDTYKKLRSYVAAPINESQTDPEED